MSYPPQYPHAGTYGQQPVPMQQMQPMQPYGAYPPQPQYQQPQYQQPMQPMRPQSPQPGVQAAVVPSKMNMKDDLFNAPFPGGETYGGATWTYSKNALGIVYKDKLHDYSKYLPCCGCWLTFTNPHRLICGCLTCSCCCDFIYFDSQIQPRSYAAVYENRIEINYPYHTCCIYLNDHIIVKHFDHVKNFAHAQAFTPYHMCCLFFPAVGEVLTEAPCAAVNYFYCPCCRNHYPSIKDADAFIKAYNAASSAFHSGNRYVSQALPPGPTPQASINA